MPTPVTPTPDRAASPRAATKRCGTCHQDKPITAFAFKDKARGRLVSKCRPCVAEYNRAHHAANKARINPQIHRISRAHRAHLVDLADQLRHTLACGTCGRDRAAGADINLLPPKHLTAGRALSEVIRDGWSTERFTDLLDATVHHPDGVRCRRCLGRETGLAHQALLRQSTTNRT